MEEVKAYILFAIIGLILAITGAIVMIFSEENQYGWAFFGCGIAIIFMSFSRVKRYFKK